MARAPGPPCGGPWCAGDAGPTRAIRPSSHIGPRFRAVGARQLALGECQVESVSEYQTGCERLESTPEATIRNIGERGAEGDAPEGKRTYDDFAIHVGTVRRWWLRRRPRQSDERWRRQQSVRPRYPPTRAPIRVRPSSQLRPYGGPCLCPYRDSPESSLARTSRLASAAEFRAPRNRATSSRRPTRRAGGWERRCQLRVGDGVAVAGGRSIGGLGHGVPGVGPSPGRCRVVSESASSVERQQTRQTTGAAPCCRR